MKVELRTLFGIIFVCAIFLGFLKDESLGNCLTILFCFLSMVAITCLAKASLSHMKKCLSLFANHGWKALVPRLRWLYLDGLIVVWLIILLAVTNHIISVTSVSGRLGLLFAWFAGCIVGLLLAKSFQKRGIRRKPIPDQ
ncbi:MAG: hypothetical protein AAF939_22470 [Planctomycetota bacterium]